MKKIRKILSFGIVLSLLFGLAVLPANAETVASGSCDYGLFWTLDTEGTLTVSGSGEMRDYGIDNMPWYSVKS